MHDPILGFVSVIIEEKVVHARFVGDIILGETGFPMPLDGILAARSVGSMTLTMDGITLTENGNVLLLIRITTGAIEWAKLGVPMGWPFQLRLA